MATIKVVCIPYHPDHASNGEVDGVTKSVIYIKYKMCSSKSQNSSELVISTKTNSNSSHLYLDPECASIK